MSLGKMNARTLLRLRSSAHLPKSNFSSANFETLSRGQKTLMVAAGGLLATGLGVCYALNQTANAADLVLHPPHYPWSHKGVISALDIASVRRGYQVYKQVCSACHSMKYVAYREFVDTIMTEEEARLEAAEAQVEDGPDARGKMFMRPGKLSDNLPSPYPNEEAARAVNNGAYPPDLSFITLARHGGEDYVFSLLTGYTDPPAGVTMQEGQHFNPYFMGGGIGMARPLYNETIEYADGTPATTSQMAKDVSTFLVWAGQPEHDERKQLFIQACFFATFMFVGAWLWKRHTWSTLKARKILYRPQK